MASKKYARADRDRCVACGACVLKCPRQAIKIWKGCFAQVDKAFCVGCGLCRNTCPADAITLKEREEG